eukprot:CAMPEP_0169459930 /NCGR_PEP_ID=MMETSP1042-20121227/18210_1 /TAXON_ID=464988 /ORGANISM="Hemiselmis andersenii, Strain CCMP1180" /LENGTH=253 /DNA_ID=CAMNT_0009572375 /DNA_START=123 /DNA_END=880 /DNA_ORIENTATION=+
MEVTPRTPAVPEQHVPDTPQDYSLPICFGDSIVLSSPDFGHAFLRGADATLSPGLIIEQLTEDAASPAISPHALHECPFKVLPAARYSARNEFAKALRIAGVDSIEGWRAKLEGDDTRMPALEDLEAAMLKEEEANEGDAEAFKGRAIVYGEPVRLLHVYSKRLLTAAAKASKTAPLCMLLNLTPQGTPDSHFVLHAPGRVLSKGDRVRGCASVQLRCERFDTLSMAVSAGGASGPQQQGSHPMVVDVMEVCL